MPGAKNRSTVGATAFGRTAEPYDFEKESEARYADELRRGRKRLLTDLVVRAQRSANAADPAPQRTHSEANDLVSKLERLSALYRAGSLSYDDLQRAKQALISEAGG